MHRQGVVGGSRAGRAANASRSADYFMKWSRLAPLQRESWLAICLRHPLHNTTKCQSKDTAPRIILVLSYYQITERISNSELTFS